MITIEKINILIYFIILSFYGAQLKGMSAPPPPDRAYNLCSSADISVERTRCQELANFSYRESLAPTFGFTTAQFKFFQSKLPPIFILIV